MPSWIVPVIAPFIVLNVVVGIVTYVTLLERKDCCNRLPMRSS
jgi:hypothetical protein